jgi:hypothetical protein
MYTATSSVLFVATCGFEQMNAESMTVETQATE